MKLADIIETFVMIFKIALYVYIVKFFGVINGLLIIYFVFFILHRKLVKFIFKLQSLNLLDRAFIIGKDCERYNMICLLKLKDYNAAKIRKFLFDKLINQEDKMHYKLTYRMFDYYWYTSDDTIYINEHTVDENEIESLLQKEANIHFDLSKDFPYKINLFNFGNNRGAILFKFDHCLIDGIGISSLLLKIADNFSIDMLPSSFHRKHSHSFIQILHSILHLPYLIVKSKMPILSKKHEKEQEGITIASISKTYQFRKLRDISKKMKISFNDIVLLVLSSALKRSNIKQDKLVCNVPIGDKSIFSRLKFIENNATGVSFTLPLKELDECLQNVHMLKDLKLMLTNKFFPYIDLNFVKILNNFIPNFVFEFVVRFVCNRFDLVITNIPGPVRKLVYAGSEIEDIIPMFSNGLLKQAIPVITYNDTVKFIYSVDKSSDHDPKEVIENIDKVYNELILNHHK